MTWATDRVGEINRMAQNSLQNPTQGGNLLPGYSNPYELNFLSDLYGSNTQANIALLNALAQLQGIGLQNQGNLDVTKQQGTNTLQNTQLQGLNAQQLQQLVNSGLLQNTQLQGQNTLANTQLLGQNALSQIALQNTGNLDLANLNNRGALDIARLTDAGNTNRAQIALQGTLAPVQAQTERFNQVFGLLGPVLAQQFGLDPSLFGQQQGTQQQQPQQQGSLPAQHPTDPYAALNEQRSREMQLAQAQKLIQQGVDPRQAGIMPGNPGPAAIGWNPGDRHFTSMTGMAPPAFSGPRIPGQQPTINPQFTQAWQQYTNQLVPQLTAIPGATKMDAKGVLHTNPDFISTHTGLDKPYVPPAGSTPTTGTGGTGTGTGGTGGTGTGTGGGFNLADSPFSLAPIVSGTQMRQMINQQTGRNVKEEAMRNEAGRTHLGASGFSARSPQLAALQNRNAIGRASADQTARTTIPMEVATRNAQFRLDTGKAMADTANAQAALGLRGQEINNAKLNSLLALLGNLAG